MRAPTRAWLAIVATVLLAACGAASVGAVRTCTITVGMTANGSVRTLHRGDRLVVRLPSNPSTGYAWTISSAGRPVLRLLSRSFLAPEDGQRVGAPGVAVFRFRAAAAGRTTLRLAYARSWETGAKPARTFTLRIVGTQ